MVIVVVVMLFVVAVFVMPVAVVGHCWSLLLQSLFLSLLLPWLLFIVVFVSSSCLPTYATDVLFLPFLLTVAVPYWLIGVFVFPLFSLAHF